MVKGLRLCGAFLTSGLSKNFAQGHLDSQLEGPGGGTSKPPVASQPALPLSACRQFYLFCTKLKLADMFCITVCDLMPDV